MKQMRCVSKMLFLLIVVLFSTLVHVWGQSQTSIFQKQFEQLSIKDGLSQNTVRTTIQDKKGFIWLGTTYGLNRYDGYAFKTYLVDRFSDNSLTNNWINALAEDAWGSIWIGTNGGGINKLSGENDSIEHISDSSGVYLKDSHVISLHFSDDTTLWVGTFNGFARYSLRSNRFISTSLRLHAEDVQHTLVHEFFTDSEGTTWICSDKGLFRWNVEHEFVERIPLFLESEASKESELRIRTITEDQHGKLWFGTRFNGVFYFNKPSSSEPILAKSFKFQSSLLSKHITSMVADKQRAIWIGTRNGIYAYDSLADTLVSYADDGVSESRFKDEMAMRLYIDSRQNLWVSAQSSGAYLTSLKKSAFNLVPLESFSIESGVHKEIWTTFAFDESVFIGTMTHLFNFSFKTHSIQPVFGPNMTKSLGQNPSPILSFVETSEGFLMASLPLGLIEFNRTSHSYRVIPNFSKGAGFRQRIFAMKRLSDATFLLGTQSGLYTYDLKKNSLNSVLTSKNEALSAINSIDKNSESSFAIGTMQGLYSFNMVTNEVALIPLQIKGQRSDYSYEVNTVHMDNQRKQLWIGTSDGLLSYQYETKETQYYGLKDGLPSSMVLGLVADTVNRVLWASTNKGLALIDLKANEKKARLIAYHSVHKHYLNEYSAGTYGSSKDGIIFFGGISGLTWFTTEDVEQLMSETRAEITVYEAIIQTENKSLSIKPNSQNEITLPASTTSVSIHFVYNDFSDIDSREYFYRIPEVSKEWISLGKAPKLTLTNVSSGQYTIEFSEKYQLGIAQGQETLEQKTTQPSVVLASLTVNLLPFFWKTWQFRIFVLFSIILTGYIYYLLRVKRLETMNQELEKNVQERTKEVVASSEKLKRSEALFRSITEHAADMIIMATPEGIIQYCSPSSSTILGIDNESIQGKNIREFIHPEDWPIVLDATKKIFSEGKAVFKPYRIKDLKGNWRYFTTSGSGIKNKDDRTEAIITVSHDVSQQQRLQEITTKAKEAAEQANQAKSNFLASISHELRTPLNAILGYSRLLADDTTLPEKQRDFAGILYKSGDHLLTMINEILDLSKIEAGKMVINEVSFSLRDMLTDLKSIFQHQASNKGLEIRVSFDGSIPSRLIGDTAKVRQILMNAIGNSIKFTDKGSITLAAKVVGKQTDRLIVELSVEDTGIGIPKNQIDQLFQPFRQVEGRFSQGTGLGLAICKKMAELLSGSVSLESMEGNGTRFCVRLPFVISIWEQSKPSSLTKVRAEESNFPISYTGKENLTILIVDDIQTNLTLLGDTLTPIGFQCLLAKDGLSALKLIYEQPVHLILLDLRMPVMSGEEVFNEIRKDSQFNSIPIVAVTASGFLDTRDSMLEQGFSACIFKPVYFPEVFSVLSKLLDITFVYSPESPTEHSTIVQMTEQDKTEDEPNLATVSHILMTELSAEQLAEFKDLMELMDWDMLSKLLVSFELKHPIKEQIQDNIVQKNYRFFLNILDELEKQA